MAISTYNFYSKALGFKTRLSAYLPQPDSYSKNWAVTTPPGKFPVMYLLHGYTMDEEEWVQLSTLGRYIENYPLVVVMPSVQRSVYADIGETHRYWTYLTEELPALVRTFFPVSDRREDTYVAGLSIGGYGALKLGLTFPERYSAAASISGVLNFAQEAQTQDWWVHDRRFNFGDQDKLTDGPHDLFYLARRMAASPGAKTRLYACSGSEDFVYPGNQEFKQLAEGLGLDFTFEVGPGDHSWDNFDPMFAHILEWLKIQPHKE
jgi:S-formylglutathione hydrolase FrmB